MPPLADASSGWTAAPSRPPLHARRHASSCKGSRFGLSKWRSEERQKKFMSATCKHGLLFFMKSASRRGNKICKMHRTMKLMARHWLQGEGAHTTAEENSSSQPPANVGVGQEYIPSWRPQARLKLPIDNSTDVNQRRSPARAALAVDRHIVPCIIL
jgi:hypothetical protein